jgi:hypothetical protein
MSDGFVRVSLDIVPTDNSIDIDKLGEVLNNPELLADVGRYLANVALPGAAGVAATGVTEGGFAHTHRNPAEYGPCGFCKTLAARNVTAAFDTDND